MKTSDLINTLTALMTEMGGDPEVLLQASCCRHGHPIAVAERGSAEFRGVPTLDELSSIVLRAGD